MNGNLSEEIKARLDIVDVVRDYLPLKAAGGNHRGLCPFHNEKSPSFMVSPDKQIWHCFGCGQGGDVFSFVMKIEGISFVEAMRSLAPRAGVEFKERNPKEASQRNKVLDILELSCKYYHWILTDQKQAEAARQYLAGRGLSDETIDYWRIGYSPDSWDDLVNFLKAKGFSDKEIFAAGMSAQSQAGNRYYNRFRGRIMFPICDVNGNVVAFTARVSPEKEASEPMGKYINSPQTAVYDKSRIIFGLDKAKMAIKRQDCAILVEGQMDVISAHQGGFSNVVASSGTALSSFQVAQLKRYSNEIALAFDMDKAGQMAAERGMEEAMAAGMHIRVITLPEGKDPDECIRKNPEAWQQSVAAARPMMEHVFDRHLAGLNLSDFRDQEKAVGGLLPIIARLGNKIEQDHWLKRLAGETGAREETLRERAVAIRQRTPVQQNSQPIKPAKPAARNSREESLSESLLSLFLAFPPILDYAARHLQAEYFAGQENQILYKKIISHYNEATEKSGSANLEPKVFFAQFERKLREDWPAGAAEDASTGQPHHLGRLALLADKEFQGFDAERARTEVLNLAALLKKSYLDSRLKDIQRLIAQAEREGREAEIASLLQEFKLLSEEIRLLGR